MEIHKPKPVHSWRELLTEIGVIVIGVAIALAAEQMVEGWRDARSSRDAREAIREELAIDLSDWLMRNKDQACIDRRLGEIGAYLEAANRNQATEPPNWIGRPRIAVSFSGQWLTATQSGRASLLPKSEAAGYANMYYTIQIAQEDGKEEQRSWAELRALERVRPLTPQMTKEFQVALSQARLFNWHIQLETLRLTEVARTVDIRPIPNYRRVGAGLNATSVCIPISTQAAKAQAMIGSYGDPD